MENNNDQEYLWKKVLANCFYLNYPGLDGMNTEYDPLRPIYPLLRLLRDKGAVLVSVKKADGTERLKLEQGMMNSDEWQRIRNEDLPDIREKLMWLFAVSVISWVTEEEAKETERLFAEALKKNGIDIPKPVKKTEQQESLF